MSNDSKPVEPAFRSCPEWHQTFGPEVADLAEMAGFAPDPEQRMALDMIFAVDRSGKSVAFEFCAICCRQNLKTGLFKQAALGWLFITDQRLIVWSAHEFNTAQEAHRDMANLIDGCSYLSKRVKQIYNSAADRSIELMSGQRLVFKARTSTGGRGLSAPKVVLDEAFALQPAHMGALLPTLSVQPDPQVMYGSSAGLPDSAVLRGIRDRGRAGMGRLAYLEWCARPGGCETDGCSHQLGAVGCALDDPSNWQAANPLLGRTRDNGTGLSLEYVRAERQALPPAEFARERMGWWDDPDTVEVFGPGYWEACAGSDYSGTFDCLVVASAVDQSSTCIAGVAFDGEHYIVKPLEYGRGQSWALDALKVLHSLQKVPVVLDAGGPAAPLKPHLEAAGVPTVPLSTSEVLDAHASLFQLVQDGKLRHARYPELDAAVAGATTRPVGDRWMWARRRSTAEISPLESVTLGVGYMFKPSFRSVYETRGALVL